MIENAPITFTEGVMKLSVQWEDVKIIVPFDLTNNHDVILYKAFRDMQQKMNKMQSQIDSLQRKKEGYLLIQDSLKEIWDNKKDDIWNSF